MIFEEGLLLINRLCISPFPRKPEMFANVSLWPSRFVKVFNVLNLQVAECAEICCRQTCEATNLPCSEHIQDNGYQDSLNLTTLPMPHHLRIPDARIKELE